MTMENINYKVDQATWMKQNTYFHLESQNILRHAPSDLFSSQSPLSDGKHKDYQRA